MEPTEQNRRVWDEVHRERAAGATGKGPLPAHVRNALADLTDKRVLHLRCGTGEATAELAELGALATGVDSSAEALDAARERWPSILWVHGETGTVPGELRRARFDLAYAGAGSLEGVRDLDRWTHEIATTLREGGALLLYDDHPVAACVDGLMRWRKGYFDQGSHRLGRIVTSVSRAPLAVRALEEYPARGDELRRHDARIPGTFLLYAQKT